MEIQRRTLLGAGALIALGACSGTDQPAGPTSTGGTSTAAGTTSPTPSPVVSSGGVSSASASSGSASSSSASPTSTAIPKLSVEVEADGLEHPWDLVFVGDAVVFTQRKGTLSVLQGGTVTEIDADLDDVVARGEGGLTGLELSPDFATDRRLIACFNSSEGDVRVVPFELSDDLRRAQRLAPLVTGLPASSSGRHSGCRPRIGPDGLLYIGTGDTAVGTIPQNLDSLGGKVLRVDPATGKGAPDNPWPSGGGTRSLVWTLGHRNVQGLAVQPGSKRIYAIEHGSSVDDEVNLLAKGANFGWNPVGSGSYDESQPMTDTGISGAVEAVWSSGDPTVATSGGDFVTGAAWAGYAGNLMVACLKAQQLLAMPIAADGTLGEVRSVPELETSQGRLRTARFDGSGTLWVTTSNGDDDRLLRVRPA